MFKDIDSEINATFPQFHTHDRFLLPTSNALNKNFDFTNHNNKTLTFIPQDDLMLFPELSYEERIFRHGLIATRKNNWHDFFNAMVWRSFPKTKSAINATHQNEIENQTTSLRSRKRDLLTLFDESGVILCADAFILEAIKNHNWTELFIENKELWLSGAIQIKTFGHALYEKYLSPYIGMTAQALLIDTLDVDACFDDYLSTKLVNRNLLNKKSELSPLPLLGIPLWHKNQDHAFYANSNYFR